MAGTDSDYQATLNLLNSIGKPQRPQATTRTVTPQLDTGFGNLLSMWIKSKILGEESVIPGSSLDAMVKGKAGSQRSKVFQGTE